MDNITEIMKLIEAGLQQDQNKVFNYAQLQYSFVIKSPQLLQE